MQEAAGGEDHSDDEREQKRPKWSREQHIRDLDSAIGWAKMDLLKLRDMILQFKLAESEEEKVRLSGSLPVREDKSSGARWLVLG